MKKHSFYLYIFLSFLVLSAGLILNGQANGQSVISNQPLSSRISYADLVEKVAPSVVTVRAERKVPAEAEPDSPENEPKAGRQDGMQSRQMQPRLQVERGLGSGVIVDSNGIILTNNHVIDGATRVRVDLSDKRTFEAKIIGTDPASDLAVLKIEMNNLPALSLGDSDKVRVGDFVLAIGNPLGLRQTVTSGIISAKGRRNDLGAGSFEDFLQTDAAINQGNSGGALVNLNGELIGINSQILSPTGGSIGIGFAIPSSMAKSVVSQLLTDGKVHRGMMGVGVQDITSDLAENFGLKEIQGVLVNSVAQGGPAAKAGLKTGDVILSINGKKIADGNEMRNKIAETAPGTEVSVGFSHNGKEQNSKIVLAEFQIPDDSNIEVNTGNETQQGKLGIALELLTPQVATKLGLKGMSDGLLVASIADGSPADDAGIEPGDVIIEVNRQAVKTTEDMQSAMAQSKNNSVLFLINRRGQTMFVTVEL